MRKLILASTLALAALSAGTAEAGSFGRACTEAASDKWMSLDALKAKVAEQGYQVRKAKLKAGCAEIYAVSQAGEQVEFFLDPTSGAILGRN